MNQTSQAGQALPGLLPLVSAQWRCLRVVSEIGDLAHAARKLHWSQAVLKAMLADLQASVGTQHVCLADDRVLLSQTLKNLIRQRALCQHPPAASAAGPTQPPPGG